MVMYTNRSDFQNDISDEIRAFLGMEEITLANGPDADEGDGLFLSVELHGGLAHARAREHGRETVYDYRVKEAGDTPLEQKRYEKRAVKIAAFRALTALFSHPGLPWGSLTGIRPTKLLRELMAQKGEAEALRVMAEEFDVERQKLQLAQEIVAVQSPIIARLGERDADVYIGIPFCKTRCLYCSFASETLGKGDKLTPYLTALKEDISLGAAILKAGGYRVRSLYVGGGTPTVLSPKALGDVLSHALFSYGGFGEEFTVEAGRPDTIDRDKLAVLKELGVGRLSINPQTMNDETLSRIGRSHTALDIKNAYALACAMGFSSINMDLIAGLPGETLMDFQATLQAVEVLRPDNLTIHTLAVKRSSRLRERLAEFPLPDGETAGRMVEMGMEYARRMGLRPYYMYRQKYMRGNLENVGYAAPGKDCVYNVDMMEETASIMAHGAGAMSKRVFQGRDLRVERIPNPKDVAVYQAKIPLLAEEKRALFLNA